MMAGHGQSWQLVVSNSFAAPQRRLARHGGWGWRAWVLVHVERLAAPLSKVRFDACQAVPRLVAVD